MKRRLVAFTLATLAAVASRDVPAQEPPALIVEEITADSAAARAGLAVGDRLVTYDEQPLQSPAALRALEENRFGTSPVTLRVRRRDELLVLNAPRGTLGLRVRPPLPAQTQTLYEDGRRAHTSKQADIAIAKWSESAASARATDVTAAAWLFGLVGEIHEGERRWTQAIAAHESAWALLEPIGDPAAKSRTSMALGRSSQNLNDFAAARRWYTLAEQIDASAGNERWVADDLFTLGVLVRPRGDLPAARDYHGRALAIRERLVPDSLEVAASLNALGIIATSVSDLTGGGDYFARAIAIRERLAPDTLDTAVMILNSGVVFFDRGDLDGAQDRYARALPVLERVAPDSLLLAGLYNNMGRVAEARGELSSAHAFHTRSVTIKQKLAPDSLTIAASFTNLGNVSRARGDVAAAEEYQRHALVIREKLAPDSLDVALSLNNLGNIARQRGHVDASRDYHTRALAIRERLSPDSLDVAMSLHNLAEIAQGRGDLSAAEDYYSRALAIKERRAPDSLNVATSLNGLASLALARGDPAAAIDYYTRTLGIRERFAPSSLAVAGSLNQLAGLHLDQGRSSTALPLLARAADIIDAQRWQVGSTEGRALLLAQHTETYERLIRAQLAQNDLAAAFGTAERARARSLLDALSEARTEIRQGVDALLLERERDIQRQLNRRAARLSELASGAQASTIAKELDALLIQYRDVQAAIRVSSPRYAALTQPQPLALSDVQRDVLDEGTVLLEYVLGEERSHVFAVTSSTIDVFELPARATIEQAARRVYDSLVARQNLPRETAPERRIRVERADADYPAAAAALSRMVLSPVAEQLSERRLLIVADGALQYVPFAALPRPGQPAGANAEPLVVRHEIVSLPSASIVPVLRRERVAGQAAERTVAVLADPVFDLQDPRLRRRQAAPTPVAPSLPADITRSARAAGLTDDRGTLSRLPFTRDEANAIMALVPGGSGTRAVDFSASRATMTSAAVGRARIVHIATHGLLDAEHPELSGLVLSLVDEQGRPQDGFLRLHEVYNLNWSADLVVLSACQTALGKEIRGEGLVGLTRGFMYGGAPRVIASLWNVNDSATAQLMTRFYAGLLGKGMTPAAALRASQVDMWRRQPARSPYYWAAFALQGEWR